MIDDLPGLFACPFDFEGNDGATGFLLGFGQFVATFGAANDKTLAELWEVEAAI